MHFENDPLREVKKKLFHSILEILHDHIHDLPPKIKVTHVTKCVNDLLKKDENAMD